MGQEPELDDLAVLHRVLSGETEAFRLVVEKYGDRLRRLCASRLGSEEEGEDAAQETLLRAYRSLGSFRLGGSFASWLFAIAANRTRTRRSRGLVEALRVERAAAEAASAQDPDPGDEALRSLEAGLLREAVAALPGEQRAAVELFYFAELSVPQAAEVLGLGEEALKSRLFRARKNLRKTLEGGQPDPGGGGILS